MGRHIVLLGDSIFDNGAYVPGWPDVAAQLRVALGDDGQVSLGAVDGSLCEHVHGQIADIPVDATHVVISAGGNDILHYAALLEQQAGNVASAVAMLEQARSEFAPAHRQMVELAASLELPVAVCTIYDANMGSLVATAISIFNDAITRHVHEAGLDLVDLRLVCNEAADYANPIEPSVAGGEKIAAALARYSLAVEDRGAVTRVFR